MDYKLTFSRCGKDVSLNIRKEDVAAYLVAAQLIGGVNNLTMKRL